MKYLQEANRFLEDSLETINEGEISKTLHNEILMDIKQATSMNDLVVPLEKYIQVSGNLSNSQLKAILSAFDRRNDLVKNFVKDDNISIGDNIKFRNKKQRLQRGVVVKVMRKNIKIKTLDDNGFSIEMSIPKDDAIKYDATKWDS